MPQVRGIQHREPYSHSALDYSNYDRFIDCAEFIVEKQSYGEEVYISIFFPRSTAPKQGVGLQLPSPEVAIAVGRALLTVGEGYISEMESHF